MNRRGFVASMLGLFGFGRGFVGRTDAGEEVTSVFDGRMTWYYVKANHVRPLTNGVLVFDNRDQAVAEAENRLKDLDWMLRANNLSLKEVVEELGYEQADPPTKRFPGLYVELCSLRR